MFGHATGRWGGLVLAALFSGKLRFSELRERVGGISEKMLAQTVRELERDGFVHRRQFRQIPPRVDYELTASGTAVAQRLMSLIRWIEDHTSNISEGSVGGSERFVARNETKAIARPRP